MNPWLVQVLLFGSTSSLEHTGAALRAAHAAEMPERCTRSIYLVDTHWCDLRPSILADPPLNMRCMPDSPCNLEYSRTCELFSDEFRAINVTVTCTDAFLNKDNEHAYFQAPSSE